ncbi:MAG: hypothetical protein ACQESR_27020 [Planctomycetota bacterium]
MKSCPTQAVRPLVGLVAEKIIRERYKSLSRFVKRTNAPVGIPRQSKQPKKPRNAPGWSRELLPFLATSRG